MQMQDFAPREGAPERGRNGYEDHAEEFIRRSHEHEAETVASRDRPAPGGDGRRRWISRHTNLQSRRRGGWDYLTADAAARHLYISRGTHVIVLDLDSGKSVGDMPDTPGVHGIMRVERL